jgi:hypothetical protein
MNARNDAGFASLAFGRHRTPHRYHAEYGGNVASGQCLRPEGA